jgi:hypothetical protein
MHFHDFNYSCRHMRSDMKTMDPQHSSSHWGNGHDRTYKLVILWNSYFLFPVTWEPKQLSGVSKSLWAQQSSPIQSYVLSSPVLCRPMCSAVQSYAGLWVQQSSPIQSYGLNSPVLCRPIFNRWVGESVLPVLPMRVRAHTQTRPITNQPNVPTHIHLLASSIPDFRTHRQRQWILHSYSHSFLISIECWS